MARVAQELALYNARAAISAHRDGRPFCFSTLIIGAEFYIEPAQCNLGVYRQIGRGNCSSSTALFIQVLNCVFTRP